MSKGISWEILCLFGILAVGVLVGLLIGAWSWGDCEGYCPNCDSRVGIGVDKTSFIVHDFENVSIGELPIHERYNENSCKFTMKIMDLECCGLIPCYKCKEDNMSVYPGILAPGDWLCPV